MDRKIFGFVAFILLFVVLAHRYMGSRFEDPDRFFHFKLARQLSSTPGALLQIPQADDMEWGTRFSDKEYLYHVLLSRFYSWGGEEGVEILHFALAAGILILIFWLGGYSLPWGSVFLILFPLVLANHQFIFRILLVRPHVLSFLLFLLLLLALQRGSYAAILFSFLFPLAYHGIYIPLIPIFCFLLTYRGGARQRVCIFSLLALTLGTVFHPHFPGSFSQSLMVVKVAFNQLDLPDSLRPQEFYFPRDWWRILDCYKGILFFYLGALLLMVRGLRPWKSEKEGHRLLWAHFLVATIFGVLTIFNFRAIVFFALSGTALAFTVAPTFRLLTRWCLVLTFLSLHLIFPGRLAGAGNGSPLLSAFREGLKMIPAGQGYRKVFNCSWDDGAYIYYLRDDLKFVDLLDPYFVFEVGRDFGQLRILAGSGHMVRAYEVIKTVFKADYALCRDPSFIHQMEKEPRVRRIFPTVFRSDADFSSLPHIYQL